jgi:hypothetical protein
VAVVVDSLAPQVAVVLAVFAQMLLVKLLVVVLLLKRLWSYHLQLITQ